MKFFDNYYKAKVKEICRHQKTMETLLLDFGSKLRNYRKRKGMSLRLVARLAGLAAPFISDIELGRRSPSPGARKVIEQALSAKRWKTKHVIGRASGNTEEEKK